MKGMLFKPEALEVWKEINPQNWNHIVNELIEIFVTTGPEQLIQIREACQKEDFDTVKKIAHTFKSGCANVGAESCYFIMSEIEYETPQERMQIQKKISEFEPQFKKFIVDLSEYRRKIQAA